MNWLQERYTMSSQVAPAMPGVAPEPSLSSSHLHLHPQSSAPSPPSQLPYEARISLNPMQYPGGVQYPQAPYTANLNFNLINNAFKPKEVGEPLPSSSPPSSHSGSPRTDDTPDQTEPSSEGPEQLSGLEIMRQQIQQIPEVISTPKGQGISIRKDMGDSLPKPTMPVPAPQAPETRDIEIHDVEDNDEELRIDEEMADEGNDSLERPIDQTFEEDKPEETGDGSRSFVAFQPYLQPRPGAAGEAGEAGTSSLEKLQQVLNNRMFSAEEPKPGPAERPAEGGEGAEPYYGFQLPEDEPGQMYQCHLCSFVGDTRISFSNHVNTHYQFQCVKCEFETKVEVEYCKHLRHEHNLSPEDLEEAEVRAPRVNSQGKVKSFKCKQCEFVAITKLEFWKHGRGHIKPEKLLFCPKCIFVTEYKHHLEYHLRNHYGTKPFKCTHCNYSCVNKSMLNSHMKSHNNVYQYRCADCTYATKYCHSLKLHLKKYSHKPAMVLNQDGSPNPLPLVDVFGNKRPKGKKGAQEDLFPPSLLPQFGGGFPGAFPPGLMQIMQMQQQLGPKLPQLPNLPNPYKREEEERGVSPPTMLPAQLRCDKCDFATSNTEVHKNHMLLHATSERSALHQLLSSPLQSKARAEHRDEPFQKLSSPQLPFQRPPPSFLERSASPPQHPPNNPFLQTLMRNEQTMPNPFLQNLMPNPAIQALMEERRKQEREAIPSSPDSITRSPSQKEEAPLPPNKRLKTDIFASLYASRMSELEKKAGEDSPPLSGGSVLDLSKESPDGGPIGGGSHGSSSDNDTASNPRSHSSSPSLGSTTKNRRKGKAFKIVQQEDTNSDEDASPAPMPSLMPIHLPEPMTEKLMCKFCGISFQNSMMHSVHMGYHGYSDPFKCNHCGDETTDALSFFLHIARKEHS